MDLIALGDTPNQMEDIIFDPLLEKETSSNHRPLQRLQPTAPAKNTFHSTSSEDLLKEYGLDFAQLAIHHQPSNNHVVNPLNNFLDDLDPLRAPQNITRYSFKYEVNYNNF